MSERFPQPLCSPWPKALPPLAGQHSRSANNSSVLPLSAYRSLLPSATPHALRISEVSSHCHQGEQILPLASIQHDHIFLFCSLHRTCHYISIRLFPCLLSSTSPRRAESFLAYSLWNPQHLEKRLTTLHPPPRPPVGHHLLLHQLVQEHLPWARPCAKVFVSFFQLNLLRSLG